MAESGCPGSVSSSYLLHELKPFWGKAGARKHVRQDVDNASGDGVLAAFALLVLCVPTFIEVRVFRTRAGRDQQRVLIGRLHMRGLLR